MASVKKHHASDSTQYCVIAAPFGNLGILTEMVDGSLMLSKIDYLPSSATLVRPTNQLAKEAEKQLKAYFENPFQSHLEPSISKEFGEVFRQFQ
jgi:methylated-DNA-[protein]-cysteine S-methyltransferase